MIVYGCYVIDDIVIEFFIVFNIEFIMIIQFQFCSVFYVYFYFGVIFEFYGSVIEFEQVIFFILLFVFMCKC